MKKIIAVFIVIMTLFCTTAFASAASDPAVTIVNPANQTLVYSDSLLVSVKITEPKTINVSVSEKKESVNGEEVSIDVNKLLSGTSEAALEQLKNAKSVPICDSESFTCTNSLSFFTKEVNSLSPGVYEIKVDTMSNSGEKLYTSTSLIGLMGKQAVEDQDKIIDTTQKNPLKFFQDLIKSLFK